MSLLGRDNVDDILIGTQSGDKFYGEQDDENHHLSKDTVSYIKSNQAVTITNEKMPDGPSGEIGASLGQGSGGHATGDEYFGIENYTGSDFNDVFTMEGDQDNVLIGGAGDDTFIGGGGDDIIEGGGTKLENGEEVLVDRSDDGTDTVKYDNAEAKIEIILADGEVEDRDEFDIHVSDDGDGGEDFLFSIEKILGSNFGDTVKFTSLNYDGELELDGGGQPEADPVLQGDLVDLSSLSGITLNADNSLEGTEIIFKNFERLKATSSADTVTLAGIKDQPGGTENGFVWADLGGGDDVAEITGRGVEVFLGAGNDTVKRAGEGTIIHLGTGEDTVEASANTRVIGADGDDRITIAGRELTGGIRGATRETPWTHLGRDGVSYSVNTVGDLVIRDASKSLMFIANYQDGLGTGDPTANITVFEASAVVGHYMEIDKPKGWVSDNWEFFFLGYKALFGKPYKPGKDPLVLDLDGDGLELLDQVNTSPVFDLDNDGFGEPTGWVFGDDGLRQAA